MSNTTANLVSFIVVLVVAIVLSIAAACVTSSLAHYSLAWDADRANGIGNSFASMTFIATWVIAFASRK